MRTDRIAINAGLNDLLALRGMESFDVAPVAVVDDQRTSPFPPFQRWVVSAGVAAGAAVYPQLGIGNNGQGMVVVDRIRFYGAIAGDLYFGLNTAARAAGVVGAMGNNSMLVQASPSLDLPNFGGVGYQYTGSATTTWTPTLLYPGGTNAGDVDADFILPPGGALLLRWNVVNTSCWFVVRGRYYDGA